MITIDPGTAQGTVAAPSFTRFNGVRGLAFSSADVLFAIIDVGPPGSAGPDNLYTIDLITGDLTDVGPTGFSGIQGLAFSPDGTLFGWNVRLELLRINASTGAAADVNATVDGRSGIQALEFSPGGTLYGARDSLLTIDTTSGENSVVGSGGFDDVRGLAFIPEPSSLRLVAMGLLGLVSVGRPRRVRV